MPRGIDNPDTRRNHIGLDVDDAGADDASDADDAGDGDDGDYGDGW